MFVQSTMLSIAFSESVHLQAGKCALQFLPVGLFFFLVSSSSNVSLTTRTQLTWFSLGHVRNNQHSHMSVDW